ncbi:MAG: FtsX-like permease family protein [Candidatus Marinimicrobia bacterium]|nr:FtsX-like permease family protein [Candidatus Neomarinimicrobiota bacterium]
MIKFLLKGLVRDRHRSLFPILIIAGGVGLSVLLYCYIQGFGSDLIRTNAIYDTGHVKIMTQAYKKIADQLPNDLALANSDQLVQELQNKYPEMEWSQRIKLGGLLDIPDEKGETKEQGPVQGIGMDLLNSNKNINRFNLHKALVEGNLPDKQGEILITKEFANNLNVKPGHTATLISNAADGSMAIYNFEISGIIQFGVSFLDKNTILVDIQDLRSALNMYNSAGEILGYFPGNFNAEKANRITADFNQEYSEEGDEFSPVMVTLRDQNGLDQMLSMINAESFIIIGIFIFVMSLVLWNTGLMSGIRRYGEIGVRLAIGESKTDVYVSLLWEGLLIGVAGTIVGNILGLAFSYYLQEVGIDVSGMMQDSSALMSTVLRARITTPAYFIGFIPGLLATFLGNAISGIGIVNRETAQLFKELER